MRIINIVDSVEKVNYGIWHAAIVNAALLAERNIQTELWYPETTFSSLPGVSNVGLPSRSIRYLQELSQIRHLDPSKDIIITHGAWNYPTRWGAWLKKRKFTWMYVPQGMLEPWALQQKWLKKRLYFHLAEKRMVSQANWIRAVSLPENNNLKLLFPGSPVRFIPNGVHVHHALPDLKMRTTPLRYLFLSRLHAKKNILSLALAWLQSGLNNNNNFELLIAGPNQGELEKLQPLLGRSTNMKYLGSIYGAEKLELLQQCAFYVLPSFSEGLPSALLEAMSYGLVPVITDHCNLPEVFSLNLGVKITTDQNNITNVLEETAGWDFSRIKNMGIQAHQFVQGQYSLEAITALQLNIFQNKN